MLKKAINISFILLCISSYSFGQDAPHATFNSSANSYIDFGTGNTMNCYDTLSQGDQLSLTLWVKWGDFSDPGVGPWANLFTMSDSTNSGDNGVWWVQHNGGNTRFEFALHTTARSFIFSNTTPVAGSWYHLACVYNGSQMQIYVNGVLENTAAKSGNIRPFPLKSKLNMGRWPNPANNYRRFNGSMDEISIWNIALSAVEINDMMTNPESLTGVNYDTTGILGYWDFDNNTANDLSPCANNGTIGTEVILPIELLNFDAVLEDDNVELNWTTLSEQDNDYFTIERSADAINWEEIIITKGAGNSNSAIDYSETDFEPIENISYYRLKQTDFNGEFSYSQIKAVNTNSDKNSLLIYPNPTNSQISVLGNAEELEQITVFNSLGKDVTKNTIINREQEQKLILDLSNLSNGLYFVKTKTSVNKVYKQ